MLLDLVRIILSPFSPVLGDLVVILLAIFALIFEQMFPLSFSPLAHIIAPRLLCFFVHHSGHLKNDAPSEHSKEFEHRDSPAYTANRAAYLKDNKPRPDLRSSLR